MRNSIFFNYLFWRNIKMARQSSNIFRINIDWIGYLAANAASLALKVQLDLNAHIIIRIKWHIITMI